MSSIQKLNCSICNPAVDAAPGIRRTVTVTSAEVTALVQHVCDTHTNRVADLVDRIDALEQTVTDLNEMFTERLSNLANAVQAMQPRLTVSQESA
jgi:TolA-binding protein